MSASQEQSEAPQLEKDSSSPEGEEEQIRTLDFSQPTKFTTELRRRIVRSLDQFCDALGNWLTGELKAEVELAVTDISQHAWAAAKAQLPADAIAVAVEARSIERHMLMSVELPLVLQSLECLLGGEASHAAGERHLTEVDWVLTRGVLDAVVHHLSVAWDELGGQELVRGELDIEGDAGVITPIGEPTLAVNFEIKIDGLASAMSLLIPWGAIEPMTERIRGGGGELTALDPQGAEALRRGVAGAGVLLRAEVGSVQMPIEHMLQLAQGALVELDQTAEAPIELFANGLCFANGSLVVTAEGMWAVQLSELLQ